MVVCKSTATNKMLNHNYTLFNTFWHICWTQTTTGSLIWNMKLQHLISMLEIFFDMVCIEVYQCIDNLIFHTSHSIFPISGFCYTVQRVILVEVIMLHLVNITHRYFWCRIGRIFGYLLVQLLYNWLSRVWLAWANLHVCKNCDKDKCIALTQ